jgi:capsid protein
MGLLDFFKSEEHLRKERAELTNQRLRERERSRDGGLNIENIGNRDSEFSGSKYGSPKYKIISRDRAVMPYSDLRKQAREIFGSSTLAKGIVGTQVNTVVGTGITWESSPDWDFLELPWDDAKRYAWTQRVEGMLRLVFRSKELDVRGQLNFETQLQRLVYSLYWAEGEVFAVLRYYKDSLDRLSPVSIQLLDPDQVVTPWASRDYERVRKAGGRILDGIEFDSEDKPVAIYVIEALGQEAKRIPFFGSDGRRFVIHFKNVDTTHQIRGISPLNAIAYELNKLEEYDIGEMEAVTTQSIFVGAVESVVGATPNRNPKLDLLNKRGVATEPSDVSYSPGIKDIRVGKKNIILNNLAPGYKFSGFQPTRPNANYAAFYEAKCKQIVNSVRVVYSVYNQEYTSSFSASRMEINSHWMQAVPLTEDFAQGFIELVREAIVREWIRQGRLDAPGYTDSPWKRFAWNKGEYIGVTKPSVDGVKEAAEDEARLRMYHTTGEKVAKKYNKTDYRDNILKRKSEIEFGRTHGIDVLDNRLTRDPDPDTPLTDDSDSDDDSEGGAKI